VSITVTTLPLDLKRAILEEARVRDKPVEQVVVDALRGQLLPKKVRDLSDIAGTWIEDPEFDRAIAESDRLHPDEVP
jgi:hypothetical protein